MTETEVGTPSPVDLAGDRALESAPLTPPGIGLPDSPYKGLSYYSEQDAPFFFGRERETQVVIANFMASRLTLLYGESGVGKSSLLRAGVSRQLHDMAVEDIGRGRKPQFVVAVFPRDDAEGTRVSWRDDPVGGIALAIEHAVASLGIEVEAPARQLRLAELLAQWTERLHCHLLLILDQFEEYLLYHEGEEGKGTLATELPRALAQDLRASFLISIREDALAKLDRFKGRITILFDSYLRVKHLDRDGARDAIVKPVDKYNELSGGETQYTVEPKLVDALLDELESGRVVVGVVGVGASESQADGGRGTTRVETPYLQLVMTRLWKEELGADSTDLRLETLVRLGHADRIVKTHLDETMRRLPQESRDVAARVFHHLVTPSGSKIAFAPGDLAEYVGLDEADVAPVLELLASGEYRILRVVASEGEDAPTRYEIFHDVLGPAILDWRAAYVHEQEEAERRRVYRDRVRTRFRTVLSVLLSVSAVATTSLAVFALVQRSDAKREATEARSLSLAAASDAQRNTRVDLALLLGLEAYRLSPRAEARSSLIGALIAAHPPEANPILRGNAGVVFGIAFDQDGSTLATAGDDGTVGLWDVGARTVGVLLRGHRGFVLTVAFSPDGGTLASAGTEGTVRLWDVRTGRSVGEPLRGHKGSVLSIAFSPEDGTLASAGTDGTVRLWDARTFEPIGEPLLGHTGSVNGVAFSPDGTTLATVGDDETLRLWDVRTREPLGGPLRGHTGAVLSVAFSPDGLTLATASADATVQLWDVETRQQLGEPLLGHTGFVLSVAFSPDGTTLGTASADGTLRLWDVDARKPLGEPLGVNELPISSVAFSPDKHTFASGGQDGTARLWEGLLWTDFRDLQTLVCSLVGHNMTPEEWTELVPGQAYRTSCPA